MVRLPEQSFAIDLSPQAVLVQRLYDEWERMAARVGPGHGDPMEAWVRSYCVATSTGHVATTLRPILFRLLGSTADVTAANHTQIIRIVRQHRPAAEREIGDNQLAQELEPRLSCAVNWATRLLPPEQRTTVARSFNTAEWNRLDDRTREALNGLVGRLGDSGDLDGLTALVYSRPKLMLGLSPDANPTPRSRRRSGSSSR